MYPAAYKTNMLDIFQPSSRSRVLDHETSPRLKFNKEDWEERKTKDPGTLAYNPHLKALCSSITFLTEKCRAGDTVLYVGGSVSSYLFTLAKMFPTLKFKLFDHNTSNFLKRAKDEGIVPSNIQHYQEIFSDQVAARLLIKENLEAGDTLLISDLRNVTKNAWGRGYVAVTDENVVNDLHLQVCLFFCVFDCFFHGKEPNSAVAKKQENWVQLIRPRSADLKFKLPYHGPSRYSFLHGQLQFQLFGKQSTSEARLIVDAPASPEDKYARVVYSRHVHDNCMYYHNFMTRLEHLDSASKIKLSYDQHMSHAILCEWMHRAFNDQNMSGIPDLEARKEWIGSIIKELHETYKQSLGLGLCSALQTFCPDIEFPTDEEAALLAIEQPLPAAASAAETLLLEGDDVTQHEKQVQRLWRKNMNHDVARRKLKMQRQLQEQIP